MPKKKTEIEDLARMIKRGFKRMATKEELAAAVRRNNEDLAAMVKRGFDDIVGRMATKDDLKSFATKDDLKNFATKDDLKSFATKDDFKLVIAEMERIGADVHDLKINTSMLVGISAGHNQEIQKLQFRVARLEKKVGLTR